MSKMMYGYFAVLMMTSILGMCNSIDSKIYFENELQEDKITKEESVSYGITKMAVNLNRAFSSKNPQENVIFSPLSIASVLAIMLLGAKGHTALEISQFLGVNHKARMNLEYRLKMLHEEYGNMLTNLLIKENEGYEIDSATGVFPQNNYPVKQDFIDKAENIYKSDVQMLDYRYRNFDAMAVINKWIANKTHDRITYMLMDPPSPETTVIFASALYFNGNWKYPFLPAATKRAPFYIGREETVDVDLMVQSTDVPYINDEKHDCQMIGLPYAGEEVYMYVILPNGNINSFMKNFSESDLDSMIHSAKNTTVIFALPKMTLENNVDVTDVLRETGLSTTFNPSRADFRNLANGAFVDQILHKVEIEVNEEGTKASAATLGSTFKSGATPVVRVDRPFLFIIYHQPTNLVLFWGKIMKPTPNFPSSKKTRRRFH